MANFLKQKPVLLQYAVTATSLLIILSISFAVSNMLLLGSINSSLRERTTYMVDNAIHYIEDRLHLHSMNAMNISLNGHVQELARHRGRSNNEFFDTSLLLIDYLRILRVTNNEISDIVIFFDNLDVFFTANGTWNRAFLDQWQYRYSYNFDISVMESSASTSVFTTGSHIIHYNNFQTGIHVFVMVNQREVENMLARFIPAHYGFFAVHSNSTVFLSNNGYISANTPDILIYDYGFFAYHFYYNPLAYPRFFNTVAIISIGIAVGIVLLTGVLLLRIKKSLYDPISSIMNQLGPSNKNDNINEFSIILNAIDVMHTSLAQKEDNYKGVSSNEITEEMLSEVNAALQNNPSNYCVLTILFEDENGNKDTTSTQNFTKAISQFKYCGIYAISKYNLYCFFVESENDYSTLSTWLNDYIGSHQGFCQGGLSIMETDKSMITQTLNFSIQAFYNSSSDILNTTKALSFLTEAVGCKILTWHNNRLIEEVLSGDLAKVKDTIMEIISANNNAGLLEKKQLLLYLHETISMVTGNKSSLDNVQRHYLENIYNLNLLFEKLWQNIEASMAVNQSEDAMLEWINENIHRNISLTDMADAMNMSYSYTSLTFKQKTGLNFLEYVQAKRVDLSKQLLRESNMDIENIAAQVGFVSANTFFRVFKKYAGVTPGKYRESGH